MPGIINVAGIHIKPKKPLSSDIQTFMDEAKQGVIYFAIGTVLESSQIPVNFRTAIFKVFGSLKQRILLKMNPENITEIPPNILVKNWFPQIDILAHKNCILFVSHGGLFGMIEAITNAVPMLIIPFFGDQPSNAIIAESKGFALKLNLKDVSEETLKAKIEELISNKKYRQKAKEISRIFNDNPRKPMDEAMYWIEYVARHKGAKHLKSAAIKLSWYQYLLLDVLLVTIILLILFMYLIRGIITRIKSVILNSKFVDNKKKLQ
jgi:glucuronosyltransferase